MGLRLAVHATAGIADGQADIGTWRQRGEVVDRTAGQFDLGRFDRERSALRHGIPRIDDEIDQNLFKLGLVGSELPVRLVELGDEANVLADQAAQQTFQVRDSGIDREDFRVQRLFATECEQLSDQRRGPFPGFQRFFGLSTKGVLRAEFRQEDLTVAHDDGQEIIEVMRDPSG